MPDAPDTGSATQSGGRFVMQKIGPLPLIVWVGLGAGAIALLIAFRSHQTSSSGQTTPVDLLGIDALRSQITATSNDLNAQLGDIRAGELTQDQLSQSITAATSGISDRLSALSDTVTGQAAGQTAAENVRTQRIAHLTELYSQMNSEENLANFTYLEAGPNDPRIQQHLSAMQSIRQQINKELATLSGG